MLTVLPAAWQVYTPLLTNKNLVQQWPSEAAESVARSCSALHCAMVMSRGTIKGETHLPLPTMDEYLTIQQVRPGVFWPTPPCDPRHSIAVS